MYNPPPAGKPLSAMPLPAGVYTGLRMPCSRRFCSGKNASGVVWKYWLRVELSRASLARGEGWHLSDEEMHALSTAFLLRDDACRSLIALVQEAAGEIERLSKPESAGRWQSMNTAPRDGTPVMIWLDDEGFAVKALWKEVPAELKEEDDERDLKMWWLPEMDIYTEDTGMHHITHWQPCLDGPRVNPQEPGHG
jgi:Protein of unknown function (DUF551)